MEFADWLALREPADAAARSPELAALVVRNKPTIYDLGSGTGSMARWLAPRLTGPQHWVLIDRDVTLLDRATLPRHAADGAPVTVETRTGDLTRMEFPDAGLITASALLDMFTAAEVDRTVAACVEARCPSLLTLSVTGQVTLDPVDRTDGEAGRAFNDHQRRDGRLGPEAVHHAIAAFETAKVPVTSRDTPWQLGTDHAELRAEWWRGWRAAAVEQAPDLPATRPLPHHATVHHLDLLANP